MIPPSLQGHLQITNISPLAGGMSAAVFQVRLLDGRAAVARFPSPYVASLVEDPVGHEFRVLQGVFDAGLPVPRPLFRETDFFVMEWLPGRATAAPEDRESFLRQMAEGLAAIHRVPPFPGLPVTRVGHIPTSEKVNRELDEDRVLAALPGCMDFAPEPFVLRHGDFWPGNLLWEDGCLTGIIDWENALSGPAAADLAISRLDVAWVFGFEAMETFTELYLSAHPIPLDSLAYWDLRAALRPMGNLEEWPGPYAALDRPEIDTRHMRSVLKEFILRRLSV